MLCGITRAVPAIAKSKAPVAMLSISASACGSRDSIAVSDKSLPDVGLRVDVKIAVDEHAGIARVKLSWLPTDVSETGRAAPSKCHGGGQNCSDSAVETSDRAASEASAAGRQPPGSCTHMPAHAGQPAASRALRLSSSAESTDRGASSAAAAEQLHELLPVLLTPLRLKGDYCNVAVLNASVATLALMQKIDASADEVVVDDSEVIRILNGHIGRPVSASRPCHAPESNSFACKHTEQSIEHGAGCLALRVI